MKIINEKLLSDLDSGRPIKIELGSGGQAREGFYSLDRLELEGVDVVADLNEPLDFLPDDSVDAVYSSHVLEHVENLLPVVEEIYRVTKKNGKVELIVPHFSNPYYYSDPTHRKFFGLYSMYYFVDQNEQPDIRKVPAFYTDARFNIESIKVEFYRITKFDKKILKRLERFINKSFKRQNFYERRLRSLFHANQIRFILRPQK